MNKLLRILLIVLLIAYVVYRLVRLMYWMTPLLTDVVVLLFAVIIIIEQFRINKER